ncbi:MAG: response regulator [Hyphomicrobiales bacterium]|nr:response regulator [Hyphomicrobiales bacterium]MBV9907120.1 response regulator [Hyphomicrobiales bacterium]
MYDALNGLTVLVVEDDWLVRENVADWFREQGCRVIDAAKGASAVGLLKDTKTVHILYTDISLADAVTGWDVGEAGRMWHPGIAVIYASGGADDPARRVPGSIFLPKPVAPLEIKEACSRLMRPISTTAKSP